jgi:hypothetical protein
MAVRLKTTFRPPLSLTTVWLLGLREDNIRTPVMRALATALSDRIDHGDARVAVGTEILADLGGAEDTVIVFSTDHGLVLGEHGLGGKGSSTSRRSTFRSSSTILEHRTRAADSTATNSWPSPTSLRQYWI